MASLDRAIAKGGQAAQRQGCSKVSEVSCGIFQQIIASTFKGMLDRTTQQLLERQENMPGILHLPSMSSECAKVETEAATQPDVALGTAVPEVPDQSCNDAAFAAACTVT